MVDLIYPVAISRLSGSKMLESGLEKRLANLIPMKPGQNRHTTKRDRIAAKLAELIAEYFPSRTSNDFDEIAASHYSPKAQEHADTG